MTGQREPHRRSSWTVALFALPILCCAGPAILAALGAGSVAAILGAATGGVALAVLGLLVVCVAVAVLVRRRARR